MSNDKKQTNSDIIHTEKMYLTIIFPLQW